jgi:hypothetical protein
MHAIKYGLMEYVTNWSIEEIAALKKSITIAKPYCTINIKEFALSLLFNLQVRPPSINKNTRNTPWLIIIQVRHKLSFPLPGDFLTKVAIVKILIIIDIMDRRNALFILISVISSVISLSGLRICLKRSAYRDIICYFTPLSHHYIHNKISLPLR